MTACLTSAKDSDSVPLLLWGHTQEETGLGRIQVQDDLVSRNGLSLWLQRKQELPNAVGDAQSH
jgi:hypothetical protein